MDRTTYGLDIAKNVMQLDWVEAETAEVGRKKLACAAEEPRATSRCHCHCHVDGMCR